MKQYRYYFVDDSVVSKLHFRRTSCYSPNSLPVGFPLREKEGVHTGLRALGLVARAVVAVAVVTKLIDYLLCTKHFGPGDTLEQSLERIDLHI